MKLRLILSLFISFMITSCGCNDDGFESFELNSFEKNVIPFDNNTNIEFIDNNSQTTDAIISEKVTDSFDLNSSDDESCFTSLVEYSECKYEFGNSDKIYYVRIAKRKFNYTDFFIYSDSQEYYTIQDLETENLELELTDISIDGFDYTQVFHLTSNNPETEFESIIYSTQNGIEFIKYRNGNHIRINE